MRDQLPITNHQLQITNYQLPIYTSPENLYMTSFPSQNQNQVVIRPFQYRDIEAMEQLCAETAEQPEKRKGCKLRLGTR